LSHLETIQNLHHPHKISQELAQINPEVASILNPSSKNNNLENGNRLL
jgi:hypothetical protein